MVLTPESRLHLVASAAIMNAIRELSQSEISGRMPHAALPQVDTVAVQVGAEKGSPTYTVQLKVQPVKGAPADSHSAEWVAVITQANGEKAVPTTIRLRDVDWSPEHPILFANLVEGPVDAMRKEWRSSAMVRVQHIARLADGFKLQYQGATLDVKVRSMRAQALSQHMLAKAKRDLSKVVVSPMPGTLVSVAVKAGDEVEAGQEVAVVEAMKMQNVLRAPRKGVIKVVPRKAGDTLAVDQVILEFEA